MGKLLFLDIDGVLNDHKPHPNGYCGILPECVYRLNKIVAETGAEIVVSSAWRYQIHEAATTLVGFKYLLMTYGLHKDVKIVGITSKDEVIPGRGPQIDNYLRKYSADPHRGNGTSPRYLVLDDGSDELPQHPEFTTMTQSLQLYHGKRWVQTDSSVGLTDADVDRAIELLGRRQD